MLKIFLILDDEKTILSLVFSDGKDIRKYLVYQVSACEDMT